MKVLGYLAKDQAMALTLSGLNGMKDQAMALTLTLVKTTEPQTWKNGVKSTVVTQAPTMAPMATMATMATTEPLTTIPTTEPLTSLNKVVTVPTMASKATMANMAPTMAPTMATMANMATPIKKLLLQLTPHGTHALTKKMSKIAWNQC